jgi:outer membrane protein assembly factor BamB
LKQWPPGGPKLLWSVRENLGEGYSSAAIADGRIFVTGMKENMGILFVFNLKGKLQWKKTYGPEWKDAWQGTRSTPTIDASRVYVHSGKGAVYCYDTKTGKLLWSKNVVEDYEGIQTEWGWAESLLIVDGMVICTPGGKKATMIALDKKTGLVVWDNVYLGEQHAFCSPILIERDNKKIIVSRTEYYIFGVNADDGTMLWKYNCEELMKPATSPQIHPNLPIYHDGHIHITSGYDAGGFMFAISSDGESIDLKWHDKTLDVYHGGAVLVDGSIYGSNYARNKRSSWISQSWESGEIIYQVDWNKNQGAVIYADERLYCYDEKTGELALVEPGPEFRVISSFKIQPSNAQFFWAHPSISDGRLYMRHGENLWCYDISQK